MRKLMKLKIKLKDLIKIQSNLQGVQIGSKVFNTQINMNTYIILAQVRKFQRAFFVICTFLLL